MQRLDKHFVLSFALAAAWLVPNHYSPWPAAWPDGLTAALLLGLAWTVARGRIAGPLLAAMVIMYSVLVWQVLTDRIHFGGDALVVAAYLGCFFLALAIGAGTGEPSALAAPPDSGMWNGLVLGWVFGAILSIGIALFQWTGAFSLGIYMADVPAGGRPFGNVAQPNHLCTIAFLGLCGLGWLRHRRLVGVCGFALAASWLLLGMVMTQSRTGWLQLGGLVLWLLAMRGRAGLRSRYLPLLLGSGFAGLTLLWPLANELLLLAAGRSLEAQVQGGTRALHWTMMLDAISREPLTGYGFSQVSLAQQRVALDHPGVHEHIAHSHNQIFDLLLWMGVLLGGLVALLLAWWLVAHVRACREGRVVWLLAAVGGLFTHALLEYPLEYLYFLVPLGLAMGAIDRLSPIGWTWSVPRPMWFGIAGLLTVTMIWMAVEYLQAEENNRVLRLESARIGVSGVQTPAVALTLLTQLEAFQQFARMEARPAMQPEALDRMRKVSERFGYPPVMFRYALAAGLNSQFEIARQTLARICKIHPVRRCDEARQGWMALQLRYPQLALVPPPPSN